MPTINGYHYHSHNGAGLVPSFIKIAIGGLLALNGLDNSWYYVPFENAASQPWYANWYSQNYGPTYSPPYYHPQYGYGFSYPRRDWSLGLGGLSLGSGLFGLFGLFGRRRRRW